jgi:hypothetical protein
MIHRQFGIILIVSMLWFPINAHAETATLVCPYTTGGGWEIILDLSHSKIVTATLNGKFIYGSVPFVKNENELTWTSFSTDGKAFQESLTRDTLELTTTDKQGYYFSMSCTLYKRKL